MTAAATDALAPTAAAPSVSLRDLALAVGGRTILRDVSFEVAPGELVAVLGPNGAGKSTLMRALLGLLAPAAGTATVLGTTPARAARRIGYLPQRRSIGASAGIRGVDLVRLGIDGDRWGLPLALTPAARARRAAESRRVADVLELVGASGYARRATGRLSGGELQRLLIAQALVRRPQLLILDEPLDALDLANQAAIAALVGRICATEGVAALLVAHDVNPLLGHVDRVVYLARGTALAGTVDEVITSAGLSALYGAPIEVLRSAAGRLVVVGAPEGAHHHER
jgi:zinc/manganese transport system ATP-binding protein